MDHSPPPVVVLVDDEDMVITSIRAFLTFETDYQIHAFTRPEDALKLLEETPVDVVVTDYLMPRITGLQLLAEAKRMQPNAARVLLTGHADKQSAIKAINEVGLYQYLEKPWDNDQLRLVIQSGSDRARLYSEIAALVRRLDVSNNELKRLQQLAIRLIL